MLGAVIVLSFGLLGVFLSLALSPSCIGEATYPAAPPSTEPQTDAIPPPAPHHLDDSPEALERKTSCIYPQEGQPGVETTHIPEEARKESEIFWEERGFDDVEGKPMPTH